MKRNFGIIFSMVYLSLGIPLVSGFSQESMNQLFSRPSGDIFPSDMIVGSIESRNEDRDVREITRRSEALLLSILRNGGSFPHLHPELERSLALILGKDGKNRMDLKPEFRFGTILFSSGYARVPFRIISDMGRTSGEMLFERLESGWMVMDVAADMKLLDIPYTGRSETFVPAF